MHEGTIVDFGIKKYQVYELIIKTAVSEKRPLDMNEIYELVESNLLKENQRLSEQGKASLRRLINTNAVQDGILYPHDRDNPGWRITPEARESIEHRQAELVFNRETETEEDYVPNSVRGKVFEDYCLGLLKKIYPYYAWHHQGKQKNNERGLDLIAEKIGELKEHYKSIGVQIKNHKPESAPAEKEWLKFLAGCFARRIDKGVFITTGKLTSEQRREAGEAELLIIEGVEELNRLAKLYSYELYEE